MSKSPRKTSKSDNKKHPKISDDKAAEIICDYMKQQNRPYNEKMVFENLHGVVGNAQCKKVMLQLAKDEKLMMKEFGKAKIFWINQNVFPETTPEQLKELETKAKQLEQDLQTKRSELKELQKEESMLGNQLSNEELESKLKELTDKTESQAKKLKSFQGDNTNETVSRQEFEKTEGLLHKALNEWKKRKKIASDILGAIGEGSGQSNKALKEMIDFEDDNDVGASLKKIEEQFQKPKSTKRPLQSLSANTKKPRIAVK